ncbi:hypothetical protein ENVG_00417 [Emiliania huxleyi virus 84]|nr:hypothetical protein ENVG_00417 [Emiliania huxleyi virus 84]
MYFLRPLAMVDVLGRFIVDLRDFLEDLRLVFLEDLRLVRLVLRRVVLLFDLEDLRVMYRDLRAFDIRFHSLTERRTMVARDARESFREPSLLFTYRRQPADIFESFATRPTLVEVVEDRVDFLTVRRRRRTVPYLERLDTAILRNFYFYTLYNIKNFEDEFLVFPVTN